MSKGKVLLGMSGGVDSSVAAAVLLEDGYDVVGVTLKLYDYDDLGFAPPDGGCCSIDLINDARLVCSKLKIPHYVIDLQDSFRHKVIDQFIDAYRIGQTPNPCVNCNVHIKWGEMLNTADKLDCDFIATGHYARISNEAGIVKLLRSADDTKDQTYALWGISKDALKRTLFPLGNLKKTETREIAKKYDFVNADRPDSQEICFVPAGDYSYIIKQKFGENDKSLQPGPILNMQGEKIGEHTGYANYTIGQRRGMGISAEKPLYVVKIDAENNSIIAGSKEDLLARKFRVTDINWLVEDNEIPERISAKIRYLHPAAPAKLYRSDDKTQVEFDDAQSAITPGQSTAFYDGDILIGGGVILGTVD